jgi:hypothetical protein
MCIVLVLLGLIFVIHLDSHVIKNHLQQLYLEDEPCGSILSLLAHSHKMVWLLLKGSVVIITQHHHCLLVLRLSDVRQSSMDLTVLSSLDECFLEHVFEEALGCLFQANRPTLSLILLIKIRTTLDLCIARFFIEHHWYLFSHTWLFLVRLILWLLTNSLLFWLIEEIVRWVNHACSEVHSWWAKQESLFILLIAWCHQQVVLYMR